MAKIYTNTAKMGTHTTKMCTNTTKMFANTTYMCANTTKRCTTNTTKICKKSTDTHPKTLQHGPLGRSWGNLFVESVLDRTLDPCFACFGAFWGALGTISAPWGTKNITRNRYQFEVLCCTRFCWSFWSTLGSLGSAFGSFLDIFSGMAAKVKTMLALTRELDFQGLGASGSVLFEGLARTSF